MGDVLACETPSGLPVSPWMSASDDGIDDNLHEGPKRLYKKGRRPNRFGCFYEFGVPLKRFRAPSKEFGGLIQGRFRVDPYSNCLIVFIKTKVPFVGAPIMRAHKALGPWPLQTPIWC